MPAATSADTIRILVSTDNHVGYNERDPIRSKDSWKTFHEVMCIAKERDVDMVLLAGDLFHENKPSRISMNEVIKALRLNCFGDKPCELEMLSDASEIFGGIFNHANYEDPDINVAIPVFSIHGNHDDPSGTGHLAALDLLQTAGLLNYYGRTPESDNIAVKPVLLQKGRTKLALYGLSNVRDERLFRTFRDGKVRFFRPNTQKGDWFNLMSVHQNHHAYTETGYLPENFLPDFMDLVIWGHEHECLIDPRYNHELGFHVMQPGSSVATSLMPGEAVPKHIALLSITGKEFQSESIRLRSVRPFVMREIVLQEEKELKNLWRRDNNRVEITRHLMSIVQELIAQANREWWDTHDEDEADEEGKPPPPLVRLRVEYSAPEGGRFDCENPQRFSNRFVGKVANVNDVIQFYRKKANATRRARGHTDMPEESVLAQLALDTVKVEKLVREFLTAQSLTILPQNSFGDAVSQFVDKDDKHAMETFVNESLSSQVKHLLKTEDVEDEDISHAMDTYRSMLEEHFAAGRIKNNRKRKLKPKPDHWDSDIDGNWSDEPAALIHSDAEMEDAEENEHTPAPPKAPAARGQGKAAATTRKAAAAPKKPPATRTARGGKRKVVEEEDEDEDEDDVIMIDDDDDDDEGLFVTQSRTTKRKPATRATASRSASPVKKATPKTRAKAPAPARAAAKPRAATQTRLNFSKTQSQAPPAAAAGMRRKAQEPSDDEISDDDAFEPAPPTTRSARTRR